MNISNTSGRSKYPAMSQDERGWLHVVFEDNTQGEDDIYYIYYNGLVWSETLNVSHDSTISHKSDIAVDTLGRIHVAWHEYTTENIIWTMYDGSSWTTPVSISDSILYPCQGPELDVSPITNYVHCVWHDLGPAEIWHTNYDGSSWSVPENVTNDGNNDAWADVVVDKLGRVHLVWMNYAAGGIMDSIEIQYSSKDSISWSSPVNISRTVGGSCDPRITVDSNNNPRVVWEERDSGEREVYYTYYDGNQWVNSVLVDTDPSGVPCISVDINNKSHIVWYHGNGVSDIYYQVFIDTTPVTPPENVTNNQGDTLASRALVSVDSEYVYLVWSESLEGTSPSANWEIYYSKELLSGVRESVEVTSFSIPDIAFSRLSFSYSLSNSSNVSIRFHDQTGRLVKVSELGYNPKGTHNCSMQVELPSGIYFFVLQVGNKLFTEKLILFNLK